MSLHVLRSTAWTPVHADAVTAEPWRNGGGRTRELLAWPSSRDPLLRISVADIDADGPFSTFAGLQRWFAVLEGAGVELRFAHGTQRITPHDAPLAFDGGEAPGCRLLDGPTRDLNLMHLGGCAAMERAEHRVAWRAGAAQCGLFSAVAGTWHGPDGQRVELPPRTLLWLAAAPQYPMHFEARRTGPGPLGWWLAFTPAEQPL